MGIPNGNVHPVPHNARWSTLGPGTDAAGTSSASPRAKLDAMEYLYELHAMMTTWMLFSDMRVLEIPHVR
jgi:hypothetical protein